MTRRTCQSCGKPLGGSLGRCHDCGGDTYRGGDPITPEWWLVELGVKPALVQDAVDDCSDNHIDSVQ